MNIEEFYSPRNFGEVHHNSSHLFFIALAFLNEVGERDLIASVKGKYISLVPFAGGNAEI